jgi:hypothetical protein
LGRPHANVAEHLSSPFDTDAHLGRKTTTGWVGYQVHLTETCEDDAPNLITHVALVVRHGVSPETSFAT